MRFSKPVLALLTLAPLTAAAAPPPGHPSPDDAMQQMRPLIRPQDVPLSRTGRVLQHMDANEYTYIQVREGGDELWLAAPRTTIADGSTIRFPDGVVMRSFYSKLLKRTFPAVIFVRAVAPAGL
ncbi:MAG: hypothetical protein KDH20_18165 [Rhodocyclaceae bacterium]|nr:hypothetical protein [Rhodocyclaceae bacterium]